MAGRITLADVQRPPGSIEGWLSQRARAAPGSDDPIAAVVVGNGGLTRAVREGVALEHLDTVESALVTRLRPDWVGVVGGGVLLRDGRPMLVRFARLRQDGGIVWVAVWLRVAGLDMGVAPDEVWQGREDALPEWLRPLVPAWPEPTDADAAAPEVADGPQTLQWRRDPSIAPPSFRVPVPDGAAFRDVVEIAAGLLEGRFGETGRADPTVVVWTGDELCGWWAEGARGARGAHALGRRLARDTDVQAVGLFGLGREDGDGGPMSMVVFAMEDRDHGPVVWVRHFERPDGRGRPRWLAASGELRVPGPRMGWFER